LQIHGRGLAAEPDRGTENRGGSVTDRGHRPPTVDGCTLSKRRLPRAPQRSSKLPHRPGTRPRRGVTLTYVNSTPTSGPESTPETTTAVLVRYIWSMPVPRAPTDPTESACAPANLDSAAGVRGPSAHRRTAQKLRISAASGTVLTVRRSGYSKPISTRTPGGMNPHINQLGTSYGQARQVAQAPPPAVRNRAGG
jgi:hypothetical protein